MKSLLALSRADIAMYFSNRRALAITLAAPILIAAFFGAVLGGAPKKPARVPIAITDLDDSAVTRKIVAAVQADTTFDIALLDEGEARERVRQGKARAALVLPKGFGEQAPRALFRPAAKKPDIAIHYDPSQSATLALVKGLLAQHAMQAVSGAAFDPSAGAGFVKDARRDVQSNAAMEGEARKDLLALFDTLERMQVRDRDKAPAERTGAMSQGLTLPFGTTESPVTSGADRKYNAYAHSFAGMGVQFVLFMGIELGMALLLMRRQGIWKRLRAAPVSRATLLGSRMLSGTVIAIALMTGIYAAAIAFFGVRIDGSAAGLVAIVIAFAVLTATFGLLIAAVGRTPEATRGIAVVATLLLVMLGGAWVPTFVFPEWLQAATLVVPTRWAIDGLEAMTWRGLGIEAAAMPVAVMLGFSALFGAIAVKRFDWDEA